MFVFVFGDDATFDRWYDVQTSAGDLRSTRHAAALRWLRALRERPRSRRTHHDPPVRKPGGFLRDLFAARPADRAATPANWTQPDRSARPGSDSGPRQRLRTLGTVSVLTAYCAGSREPADEPSRRKACAGP